MASAFVPESAGSGDDDKVYFFFSERAVEYDCYAEQVVARVARVCKVRGHAWGHLGTRPEVLVGFGQCWPLQWAPGAKRCRGWAWSEWVFLSYCCYYFIFIIISIIVIIIIISNSSVSVMESVHFY